MAFISHLRLRHFRNCTSLDTEFGPGLNLFCGANAQGKTSLLEALHYISLLRSFRTRKISDLAHWESDYFYAEAELREPGGAASHTRLCAAYREKRRLRINGQLIHRASEFINNFLCVPFVPEDIGLIKGNPAGRRRFMDIVLSQVSPEYLSHIMDYAAVLKSRNAILRERGKYGDTALTAYERLLSEHGSYMILARHEFAHEFSKRFAGTCRRLFGEQPEFSVRYVPNGFRNQPLDKDCGALRDTLREMWERERVRDVEQGTTRTGPHRDDLLLQINNRPVADFGSEGQCRVASLALRLASAEHLLANESGKGIILLIDDVLGELDRQRQHLFFQEFQRAEQVFMACTEIPSNMENMKHQHFTVTDGKLLK